MPASELKLTPQQLKKLREKYDDLTIQSMLFDMDIDIETGQIVEKSTYKEPYWITRWHDKQASGDNDPADPEQAGW